MDEMTSRERVLAALKGENVDRIPVISVCQHATYDQMRELDSYWPDAMHDPQLMAKLAGGASTILGFDAVRLPFCQTHEAEALGATLKDGGKEGLPSVAEHPYKLGEPVEFPEDFLSKGRIPKLLEGIKVLKETVGDKAIVMGGIIGPFSIAGMLVDITQMLMAAFKNPDKVKPYVEAGERAGTMLAKAMIDAGADVICIEDMMASLDMISPKIYRDLAAPYEEKQIKAIGVPTIMHICGKLNNIIVDMAKTGCTAISVEPVVDATKALEDLKEAGLATPLVGAIDPINTLYHGTEETAKADVLECIEKGFTMISPGCSVPPASKTETLKALVEAVSEKK